MFCMVLNREYQKTLEQEDDIKNHIHIWKNNKKIYLEKGVLAMP